GAPPAPPRAGGSHYRGAPPRTSCSARSRSPRKSACTRTRTSRFWSFDGRADPHTRRQAARCTGCTRRDATVARGAAAPEDRGRAGPLHRGPGGGEEGGRDRGAQPLAPLAGARGHPDEILPNNIIMIGPTGVGKTEIA